MSGSHSALSASGAPRWARCVASPAACRNEPEQRTSEPAAKGTAKHAVSEHCLRTNTDAEAYASPSIAADGFTFKVDSEFRTHVQAYVDTVRRIPGSKLYEVRLDTSGVLGVPDQGGTSDAVVLDFDALTIWVIDAKFGYNKVMADSEQLLIYLDSAFEQFGHLADWKFGKCVISQPPVDHYDEKTYTIEECAAAMAPIKAAAQKAWALLQLPPFNADAIRAAMVPGEKQCQWCAIRGNCSARADRALSMFPPVIGSTEKPHTVEDALVLSWRDQVDEIEKWCADVRAEVESRAKLRPMKGWKWVTGRAGNRAWDDEVVAEAALKKLLPDEKVYQPRKLIGVPEAQKQLGKAALDEKMADYIKQPPGKNTLVRDNDPREPSNNAIVEFGLVTS